MDSQLNNLQVELDQARAMAFKMMAVSSEMGQITQFLKRSFAAESYECLAHDLMEHLAGQSLKSSVLIHDISGRLFFALHDGDDLLNEAFIARHQHKGRLLEFDDRLLINFSNCSLLVEDIPEEEGRRGELRDSLAILMEGVSARVQSLSQEELSEEGQRVKNEFFSLMSHELRTPLNPIIGYASRLSRKLSDSIDSRDLRALDNIREHGEHLLRQVNDILDFVRVKNGEIKLNPEHTDIRQLIAMVVRECEPLMSKFEVTLEREDVGDALPFFGDPLRMRDVILALLSNAIKYSPKSTVGISSGFRLGELGEEKLIIEFKDAGVGIDVSQHERVFHHFTERDTAEAQKQHSPGVSLYVARELVRLHGGSIELEGSLGSGSTFRVVLPGISETPYPK